MSRPTSNSRLMRSLTHHHKIYNCIRDYSEQILTRWLNTYANHTAALRQLQQAGLYPTQRVASGPHMIGEQTMCASVNSRRSQYIPPPLIRRSPLSVVGCDVTPENAAAAPGTSGMQPVNVPSKRAIPPPLPEKAKPFPGSRPTSFQIPPADKPFSHLKYENPRPRPASWQAMPETTGALFKALKRLSESEGLIPQEYVQLLERASRQEVPLTEINLRLETAFLQVLYNRAPLVVLSLLPKLQMSARLFAGSGHPLVIRPLAAAPMMGITHIIDWIKPLRPLPTLRAVTQGTQLQD